MKIPQVMCQTLLDLILHCKLNAILSIADSIYAFKVIVND